MDIYIAGVDIDIAIYRLLGHCYLFPPGYKCIVQASMWYEYMYYVIFGVGEAACYHRL